MNMGQTAVPLIDRLDFDSLLAENRFGRWSEQACNLHRHGYCILDIADQITVQDCEHLIDVFAKQLARDLEEWEAGRSGSMRVQDGWKDEPAVRRLALHPLVLDLLSSLYGRDPFAFQTLNFAVGSEQPYHSDAVHFHSQPHGFMCGVWIPLADVEPDSGPLVYYPGSHRLPYRSAASLGLTPDQVATEPHPQCFFEPGWQEDVQRLGFQPQLFFPRRGQALIWHANLLHGGSSVANRRSRRWSQVVHFYFEDCLYTTPMKCFSPDQGGACFRTPVDIATGHTIDLSMQRSRMDIAAGFARGDTDRAKPKKRTKVRQWFTRIRSAPAQMLGTGLMGNIELISPTLITGWLYHPDFVLSDVRLICGKQLLASAPIKEDRLDVTAALGLSGMPFGFRLDIPDNHPEPSLDDTIQILALTADGSTRFPLNLSESQAGHTEARLRSALASRYRGLCGHFDGFSPSGEHLIGWCYSPFAQHVHVWLHAEGLKPRKISCNHPRPGMSMQGHDSECGFTVPIADWPEAAAKQIFISFDEQGELRLPPLRTFRLPSLRESQDD